MTAIADRHLLFGLLALQNGLIDQGQLVAAFHAWTLDMSRTLADHLEARGDLDAEDRAAVEALVARHLKRHGGDIEASLASVEIGVATRARLARAAGAAIEPSLARVGTSRRSEPGAHWRRVCDVFASVLRREPAQWAAHLDRACGGDPILRADVERLLADDAGADSEGFLDLPGAPMPLVPDGGGPASSTTVFPADIAANSDQRFRVLRPHARGGLGAVFVAVDTELNREVALKQILDHHADDPELRRRFLLEAEITGGLEHPGIVPVYSLGSYHDGRPYYSMRFIRGDSLRDAIARFHNADAYRSDPGGRSLELRKLLRGFIDVCNAVEYAHSRGVLHRDIKPGNVIVGRYGETLVVDWGLAKPMGHAVSEAAADERTLVPSSGSGSAETMPGSAVGTPAYMSPEQASGDLGRLGTRSDVYSLGATLYCLLTGRPPFHGDALEVLARVRHGDIPPPTTIDPSIDPALAAVCMKAMATRPEDRYSSCRALAEEVERWTADEPVTAYREPFARRARRWAVRNRTAVTGVVVALVAGVLGLSAVLAVQTRANAELTRSKEAVQARYDLAVEAIATFHTGVSQDFLLQQDQFKELRDRLLKSAANFYDKLGALLGKETDMASRRALAQANFEVASLTGQVGRPEDALAAHRTVLARREALAAEPGAHPEAMADVGRSMTAVASLLRSTGRTVEAEATYRKAEALFAGLSRSLPSERAALADCRSQLGDLLSLTGRSAAALEAYRLARADQEAPAAAPEAMNETRRDLADTINSIGRLLAITGDLAGAETEFRKALALRQKLVDDNPAVAEFRSRLSASHNNLGLLLQGRGQPAASEAEFRKSLALRQRLAHDNPAVTEFCSRLADIHENLRLLLSTTGNPAGAEAEARKALAVQQKLVDGNPARTEFRMRLAEIHNKLSKQLLDSGDPTAAEAEARNALAHYQKLADDSPTVAEFRSRLAGSLNNLGNLLSDTGNPAGAEVEYRKLLALRQRLADDNPEVTLYRKELAIAHWWLGNFVERQGHPDSAIAAYREAARLDGDHVGSAIQDLGRMLSRTGRNAAAVTAMSELRTRVEAKALSNPESTELQGELGRLSLALGEILTEAGDLPAALAAHEKALAIRQKLADGNPKVSEYRDDLASSCTKIADAVRTLGRPAEALEGCERAIAIRQSLIQEEPKSTIYRSHLASSLRRRGLARREMGDPAGTAADVRRAMALYDGLPSRSGEEWFETSCCHAALADLAGRDGSGVSAADAASEAGKALALLAKAVTMDYTNPHPYRTESSLDSLRERPDFRELMIDLVFPADPFAW
jgi:eukaryotic-like serine/threonine-protein kinase